MLLRGACLAVSLAAGAAVGQEGAGVGRDYVSAIQERPTGRFAIGPSVAIEALCGCVASHASWINRCRLGSLKSADFARSPLFVELKRELYSSKPEDRLLMMRLLAPEAIQPVWPRDTLGIELQGHLFVCKRGRFDYAAALDRLTSEAELLWGELPRGHFGCGLDRHDMRRLLSGADVSPESKGCVAPLLRALHDGSDAAGDTRVVALELLHYWPDDPREHEPAEKYSHDRFDAAELFVVGRQDQWRALLTVCDRIEALSKRIEARWGAGLRDDPKWGPVVTMMPTFGQSYGGTWRIRKFVESVLAHLDSSPSATRTRLPWAAVRHFSQMLREPPATGSIKNLAGEPVARIERAQVMVAGQPTIRVRFAVPEKK